MKTHPRYWTLLMLVLAATATAEFVSNPVFDGAITVDQSRTDWELVTPYSRDPQDASGGADYDTIWMAHDSSTLYIRFTTYDGSPPFATDSWRYNIFVDLDQNRNTGFIGGAAQFSVGAEFLIQGISVWAFAGQNQTDWLWNYVGSGLWNNLGNDVELAFPVSLFSGMGTQFNWIGFGDSTPPDHVPDTADNGESGQFHTYGIPEPTLVGLYVFGLLLTICRRRTAMN